MTGNCDSSGILRVSTFFTIFAVIQTHLSNGMNKIIGLFLLIAPFSLAAQVITYDTIRVSHRNG